MGTPREDGRSPSLLSVELRVLTRILASMVIPEAFLTPLLVGQETSREDTHKTISRSWALYFLHDIKKPTEPTPVLISFINTNSKCLTKIWTWSGFIQELHVPSLPPPPSPSIICIGGFQTFSQQPIARNPFHTAIYKYKWLTQKLHSNIFYCTLC